MAGRPSIGVRIPQYGATWDEILRDGAERRGARVRRRVGQRPPAVAGARQGRARLRRPDHAGGARDPDRPRASRDGGALGVVPPPGGRGQDAHDHRRAERGTAGRGPRHRLGRGRAPRLRHPVRRARRPHRGARRGARHHARDVHRRPRRTSQSPTAGRPRAGRRSGSRPTSRACCGWPESGPTASWWPSPTRPRRGAGSPWPTRRAARPDGVPWRAPSTRSPSPCPRDARRSPGWRRRPRRSARPRPR